MVARCMARIRALTLAALAFLGVAASNSVPHSRHGHLRHRHLARFLSHTQVPSDEDSQPKKEEDESKSLPLYDDFLDVMNNAAAKALEQQRAIPAYDDFLHLMKGSAEKAYQQQAGPPSYDEFLHFMKGKSDEAYSQQAQVPSYDDFLAALKESSVEALKTPVPSYEDFLNVLKDGAEKAREKRIASTPEMAAEMAADEAAMHDSSISALKENPLDRIVKDMGGGADKAQRQVEGKKDEDDDTRSLREELEKLEEEQKKHKAGPHQKGRKPLMQRINVLRTQLCWKRPNLWQHEKCMRFLGIHCMQESTGEGICRAFTKEAKKRCKESKDPHWKEDYCALAEALGESYETEDEEEEEAAQEEELEEGAEEGAVDVEDGEDLDDDSGLDDDLIGDKKGKEGEAIQGEGEDVIEEEDGSKGADKDGDGVLDKDDAFPDDPNEWKDTDADGIGDNADEDLDGDGHNNDVDVFPADPKEWKDSDSDGIGDNADKDRDNDGFEDDKDKFPDDPTEWIDTDGDGVGDNKDAYPYNPNCSSPVEPCEDESKTGPKKGSPQDPSTLDMDALRPLPEQGYNEVAPGAPVNHNNYYTWVSDWQDEFPDMEFTEKSTLAKICREHPQNSWCDKFKNHDAHFR